MNEIKILNKGDKFAHATVGILRPFDGKLFVKDSTDATSCEISFGSLARNEEIPFFHSHKQNEENYIILSGKGRFQVDDQAFDIAEGSVIRVSTGCDRNIKCTSDDSMAYICIQAKENSLGGYSKTDGVVTERENIL